jgi:hypothetical protein
MEPAFIGRWFPSWERPDRAPAILPCNTGAQRSTCLLNLPVAELRKFRVLEHAAAGSIASP